MEKGTCPVQFHFAGFDITEMMTLQNKSSFTKLYSTTCEFHVTLVFAIIRLIQLCSLLVWFEFHFLTSGI